MIDRSPAGKLEVAGGVLRYMHNCNWKMLVENQTDTCHPMVAHESSAGTAMSRSGNRRRPARPEADGGRDLRAVHGALRFLREHGHPRLGQWPRPYRRVALHPFRLFRRAGLFRADGRRLWRGARQGDPRREPPQHRLFPQRHAQGADPAAAPLQAGRREPHAGRSPGPSGWSARRTCCWSAR